MGGGFAFAARPHTLRLRLRNLGPQTVRAIKAVVIILGVLILVVLGAVIWAVLNLDDSGGVRSVDESAAEPAAWDLSLDLPAGCEIAATQIDGRRLVVRTVGPAGLAGCGRIHIVDLKRGEVLGTVAP